MPIEQTAAGKSIRVNMIRKGEKCLEVEFINNEFPKADLEFTFDKRSWHLYDGGRYKLPWTVIEHLNGLIIPESRYEEDPETHQITHIATSTRHRFTCSPVNLGEIIGARTKSEKKSEED